MSSVDTGSGIAPIVTGAAIGGAVGAGVAGLGLKASKQVFTKMIGNVPKDEFLSIATKCVQDRANLLPQLARRGVALPMYKGNPAIHAVKLSEKTSMLFTKPMLDKMIGWLKSPMKTVGKVGAVLACVGAAMGAVASLFNGGKAVA